MERFDIAVIGAGAAGQFCAAQAGQRGRSVVLIDHADKLGEKIRISGGGRCNFTNLNGDDERRFLSQEPRFARHALRSFRPRDFIDLVRAHRIGFHEKHLGQLFCDDGSGAILDLLAAECAAGQVSLRHPVRDLAIRPPAEAGPGVRWRLSGDRLDVAARAVVIATGGPSIPAIGGSDFAWRLARDLGLATVAARPGLVPLTCDEAWRQRFAGLAGVALPVRIGLVDKAAETANGNGTAKAAARGVPFFDEDLLFTHRGLSGPAVLQISSYRDQGQSLLIDLAPGADLARRLADEASTGTVGRILQDLLPRRLVAVMLADGPDPAIRPVEVGRVRLAALVDQIRRLTVHPNGTEGLKKAEVTCGGIATRELDPRSLEARRLPGLYCIGEAVDVTGWLGGYNFQWAWASATVAAAALAERLRASN